ncbi:putative carboxylesterase nap [Roseimaritima multifibrata]|uniref:Putative carboxylesterase nap n=1 Tax=Roseimaritima multifibrata TaxID=1930274 RepID=A0A517MJR2_9BACT|nr:alpha/beta hydrolase [Roseimaritima multifibrata]QDS95080.1 putative carboxylesterase nap [Roseimaritima multifibrata]
MKSVIWKTQDGKGRLNDWYDRFVDKIETEVSETIVPTRYGASHVLVSGLENGRPLVCLHAMRTGSPFLVSEMGPVLKRFRVYAPDLPGQSIRGPEIKLPLNDNSLALWLIDVMDGLELDQVNLFGVSWGGFLARLTATTAPARVSRLALMVPAGIANGSHLSGLMKMVFPMVRYKIRPSSSNLRKLLLPILSTWDDDWAGMIECTLRDMKMDLRIPPLASDQDLEQLTMPTLVLAGENDISFPGRDVIDRLRGRLPNIDVELMPECKHSPPTTDAFREWLGDRLSQFLDDPK